ncbi:hypothetical protein M404DRAFT_995596 [Pisolithus tinctorius Marx 270]|uniref:Uncharacterized protein n=1 Tax=Pisolithus tinctorius Marx 270 TaxID=870435 RepID=A0A0C3PPL9_PISTI|nr:hypothetical protein M404DRAFT_995596 [Pisolithus tinctorius Marx 270]
MRVTFDVHDEAGIKSVSPRRAETWNPSSAENYQSGVIACVDGSHLHLPVSP